MTRLRFAPSPTGYIHAGNLRTALFNYLVARQHKGTFILRLDDTDAERSTVAYAEAIKTDLEWLGLVPDQCIKQSDRLQRYAEVKQMLIDQGRLYPCFETPETLDLRRKLMLAQGKPPVYDRAALNISDEVRKTLISEGKRPHWRFRLSDKTMRMDDAIRGSVEIDLTKVSDPIVMREDGTWLYMLTSVIDDVDMTIDWVVRGDDHVTNTLVQMDMFIALGAKPPRFAHHNLLLGEDGSGLSKRKGDQSIGHLRAEGYEPMAINSLVGLTGTSDAVDLKTDLNDLAVNFAFDKISRAPARFSKPELDRINQRCLHHLPYIDAEPRLKQLGLNLSEAAWLAFRANLNKFNDILIWAKPFAPDFSPPVLTDDSAFIKDAVTLLPPEPWNEATWNAWIEVIKTTTDRRGAKLFKPIRRALTDQEQGPELALILPLLGYETVKTRLLKACAV